MKIVCQDGLLPGTTVREKFEACKAFGFDGIEVGGRRLREDPEIYIQLSRDLELPVTSICLGWDGCLLDADPKERQKAMDGMVELLQLGDALGGAGLVVPPIFDKPRIPDFDPLIDIITLEKRLLVLLLRQIAERVQGYKSVLLLEPLNRYEQHLLRKVADGVEIAEQVSSPNISVLADIFHMHIEEASIENTLRQYAPQIGHVHLADSNRLLPGQGFLDFPLYIRMLVEAGYNGVMALECGVSGDRNVELPRCREYLAQLVAEAEAEHA